MHWTRSSPRLLALGFTSWHKAWSLGQTMSSTLDSCICIESSVISHNRPLFIVHLPINTQPTLLPPSCHHRRHNYDCSKSQCIRRFLDNAIGWFSVESNSSPDALIAVWFLYGNLARGSRSHSSCQNAILWHRRWLHRTTDRSVQLSLSHRESRRVQRKVF